MEIGIVDPNTDFWLSTTGLILTGVTLLGAVVVFAVGLYEYSKGQRWSERLRFCDFTIQDNAIEAVDFYDRRYVFDIETGRETAA